MMTALKKIGERISGKNNKLEAVKSEKYQEEPEEEKFVVYANINSQQEDYTFLVTALYHWEMMHKHIQNGQNQDLSKIKIAKGKGKPKKKKVETPAYVTKFLE